MTPVAPSPEVVAASLDNAVLKYESLTDLTRDGLDTIYQVMVGMTFGELAASARSEITSLNAENLIYLQRQFEHLNKTLAISQEQDQLLMELEAINAEALAIREEAQRAPAGDPEINARLQAIGQKVMPYRSRLIEMERRVQEDLMQMVTLIGGMPS